MILKIFLTAVAFLTFVIVVRGNDNNYVPGELILMLDNKADAMKLQREFGFLNLRPKEVLVEDLNIWLYQYDYERMQADLVLDRIRRNKAVFIAQFNHYVTERSVFPNDTRWSEQWSLNNTGQGGGTPDADIDAPEAWDITTGGLSSQGDSIIVAIVDCGFYLTHQDIKFWKNYEEIPNNNIDDDGNGYVDDYDGWNAINNNGTISGCTHGTHVSGIAGAIGNNNNGIAGVNWGVKIMAVQGSSGTEAVVVRAYGYVLKERKLYNQSNGVHGAFVVSTNSSFGVDYGQPSNYPLWCAFYDSLGSAGILNACATANLNINIDVAGDIPTACPSPFMVSVTNTTNRDFKNTGAAWGPITIDLGAPGTSILSCTTAPNNYSNLTGTSMATPHVAGAFALMFAAASPSLIQAYKNNPGPVALIFKQKMLDGVDQRPSWHDSTVSGGRLNLYNSILLIQGLTGNGNITESTPKEYRLNQNFPNPFNPSTLIRYSISENTYARMVIFDALGRELAEPVDGQLKPGNYEAIWNAKDYPSGVYFYKLTAGDFSETRKMILMK